MTDLTTYTGQPTTPHEVPSAEATGWACSDCGQNVMTDDGAYWWHVDPRYQPAEDPTDD